MKPPPHSTESRETTTRSGTGPALTLMVLAPLIAELLPGATRFSSIFVLPIEIFMWGGGALFIRYAVRRWRLGWRNMMFLALALALAEECVIQQTSLAPMVIQVKGEAYARAFGVNYVYLLWALVYESVFVVFVPIHLAELLFRERREDLWLNKTGKILIALLFFLGAFLAWFSWTQIARPTVFHVPVYNPPHAYLLLAITLIAVLVYSALGPFRYALARQSRPWVPPKPWVLATLSCIWANLWYTLVLLAFGVAPTFPPAIATGIGILLAATIVLLLPHWTAHSLWNNAHQYCVIAGAIIGSMMLSFVGFIGALPMDLYFKIGLDLLASVLLIVFGLRRRQTAPLTA